MNIKEGKGCAYNHLRNAIDYILDVKHEEEKTEHGLLVGGNAGMDHKEILATFLETKSLFGKPDGRQGYHFVISFAKGETNEATAYEVVKEFCEEYLGDNYDYVFAIHNDKAHMHGHIIFNSVSRIDGYKYHYKKGDWEKQIQPVTDRICEEHELAPLTFEEEKVGVSYAEWAAKSEQKINWSHIIRADVDYAIAKAASFEEFKEVLSKMNYQIREGYSKKRKGTYYTFIFTDQDGKAHRRRSYNLPDGYSPQQIRQRILTKEGSRTYEEVMEKLATKSADYLKGGVTKSSKTYKRLYQAVAYYKLPNPYAVPAYQVRKDMLRLDRLIEECRYLKTNHVKNVGTLDARQKQLMEKESNLKKKRSALYGILNQMPEEKRQAMEQYAMLQKDMLLSEKQGDDRFEDIEDQMKDLEQQYPHEALEVKGRIEEYGLQLKQIKTELRMLKRIIGTEHQELAQDVAVKL